MRPRLARRGELLWMAFPQSTLQRLQCGPGSLAGENLTAIRRALGCRLASMRPRLARRGELSNGITLCFRCHKASMRPRLARRGERDALNKAGATRDSFNAAPARSPGRTQT